MYSHTVFTHCLFENSKSKHNFYGGADFMKKFSVDQKNHAREIISYEKKEMLPLTGEEFESYSD